MFRGRDYDGLLSQAAEEKSIKHRNELLDGLIARRPQMERATKNQLSKLFARPGYGSSTDAGETNTTARSRLTAAIKAGVI